MGDVTLFGRTVSLPAGWQEETAYLFAGPAAAPARPNRAGAAPARPTISVARFSAKSLDAAVATLTTPEELGRVDVLVDDMREVEGRSFYERVVRFADPASGLPVQQSTRVYFAERSGANVGTIPAGGAQRSKQELAAGTAWIAVFMTQAMEFKAGYDAFSRFAGELAAQLESEAP